MLMQHERKTYKQTRFRVYNINKVFYPCGIPYKELIHYLDSPLISKNPLQYLLTYMLKVGR